MSTNRQTKYKTFKSITIPQVKTAGGRGARGENKVLDLSQQQGAEKIILSQSPQYLMTLVGYQGDREGIPGQL